MKQFKDILKTKIFSIALILFCTLPLSAGWEIKVMPHIMANLGDQLRYVLPHRGLQITSVSKVEPDQPFYVNAALILKTPLKKPVKFSGSITMTDPDGKAAFPKPADISFTMPAGARGIHIFPNGIIVKADKQDKRGKQRFSLTVSDDCGNAQTASAEIELVDSITDFRMMDFKEFNKFIQSYYMAPKPERLLAALNYYLTEGITELRHKSRRFNPLPGLLFFADAFRYNPQFFDELIQMGNSAKPKDQYFATIYYHIGQKFIDLHKDKINPVILKQISKYKKPLITANDEIKFPQQLDLLWMKFYANGKFEFVHKIAGTLKKQPELSAKEAQQIMASGKKLSPEQRQHLLNSVTRVGSAGSLIANSVRHRVVRFYLETILTKKLYPDKQAEDTISWILSRAKEKAKSTQGNKK